MLFLMFLKITICLPHCESAQKSDIASNQCILKLLFDAIQNLNNNDHSADL